jgi:hypothetical protein
MTFLEDLGKALTSYIEEKFFSLRDSYKWDFSIENFPNKEYKFEGQTPYENSKLLRQFIHLAISQNDDLKVEYQKWYVRDWGGVRGNNDATIETYISTPSSDLFKLETRGIATWSKILCVRDPSQFSIYDARVALALNSLQRRHLIKNPLLFPLLPSQNKSFVLPRHKLITDSLFFSSQVPQFYSTYLSLLTGAANNKPWDIQDIEMILFSNSKELSEIWEKGNSTDGMRLVKSHS